MGSYALSQTRTSAVDSRQAATDNGINLSGGNLALGASIFNLNASSTAAIDQRGGSQYSSRKATGGKSEGGTINLQVLDGGAIQKSYDFAAFSLSEILGAFVNQTREQTEATTNTLSTIGEAISSATTTTQQATEEAKKSNNNLKNIALLSGVLVAGWWFFFKGKK